jgi:hypothetical protein
MMYTLMLATCLLTSQVADEEHLTFQTCSVGTARYLQFYTLEECKAVAQKFEDGRALANEDEAVWAFCT